MANTNSGIVTIHGKDYMTVARRVEIAHEKKVLDSIETEVVSFDPIVVRAKVSVKGKDKSQTFTGISAVIPEQARAIEKENPFEVAETSAVGRALGFAGFGIIDSVATADEVVRSQEVMNAPSARQIEDRCPICGSDARVKTGKTKMGKGYKALICSSGDRTHTRWYYGNYAN
jgi:hypothetical protein